MQIIGGYEVVVVLDTNANKGVLPEYLAAYQDGLLNSTYFGRGVRGGPRWQYENMERQIFLSEQERGDSLSDDDKRDLDSDSLWF